MTEDDISAFNRTLAKGPIVQQQHVVFENMQELPASTLKYALVPKSLEKGPTADSYWAEVQISLQIEGYDARPVRSYDHWLFKPTRDGQRYLLASTTDKEWEGSHDTGTEPWDVGKVFVDEYGSVLGIFDSATAAQAARVVRIVSEAKDDVSLTLPESEQPDIDDGTIVYVLGDQTVINGLRGTAVGDPDNADGLTMAMPVDVDDPNAGTASYRVSFNARVLSQPESVIGRLVRHELTHAALGAKAKGAPLWLSEGIAEWTSVRPMPQSQRRLPTSALTVAASATDLPTSDDFAGSDAAAWYAVSWWVCEYIANTYGQKMLWTLLDKLAGGADQDQVLSDELQLTPSELVRRGAALMSATYS